MYMTKIILLLATFRSSWANFMRQLMVRWPYHISTDCDRSLVPPSPACFPLFLIEISSFTWSVQSVTTRSLITWSWLITSPGPIMCCEAVRSAILATACLLVPSDLSTFLLHKPRVVMDDVKSATDHMWSYCGHQVVMWPSVAWWSGNMACCRVCRLHSLYHNTNLSTFVMLVVLVLICRFVCHASCILLSSCGVHIFVSLWKSCRVKLV